VRAAEPTARGEPPLGLIERILDSTPLRLTLFLLVVFVTMASTMGHLPRQGGDTPDWQFFQLFDEIARKTVVEFGQFPIWNPYYCGGTTLIGNPQTTYLVPTFPLVLLFGTTFGMRLSILVVIVLSCEGAYRLMRHLGARPAAALLVSFAFPLYGRTFGWIRHGQYGLHGETLAVWVLYGYLRGLERPAYLALGAAFLAWIVCYRGIQPGPQLAIAFGLWAVLEAHRRWVEQRTLRAALWPLAALGVMGLLAAGYTALRMVPLLQTVLAHPRIQIESTWRSFSHAFVEVYGVPPGTKGFDPAAGYAYVGVATYLLAVAAVFFARARRRAAIPLVVALVFSLICLGYQGEFSLYPWMKKTPLLASLRNPTLYTFTGALFVALAAGLCLDELQRWLMRRSFVLVRLAAAVILPALALGVGLDVAWHGRDAIAGQRFPWVTPPRVAREFRQARGNYWMFPMWPYVDRGTLSCYDETPWPATAALRGDLPADEYLAEPDAGTVRRLRWSPNRIDLEVTLRRPGTVVVNQNHDPGWRASAGKVRSHLGLVAVDLPAGTTRLTLRVWPPLCTVGVLLTAVALAATALLVRRGRRRRG
jgi:hypothetical protein